MFRSRCCGTRLDGDDAAGFVVERLAWVIPVQLEQLGVGFVAERFATHSAEVKMEAVQKEVNFDPGLCGLWTHSRSRTQDESCVVHLAVGFVLKGRKGSLNSLSLSFNDTIR